MSSFETADLSEAAGSNLDYRSMSDLRLQDHFCSIVREVSSRLDRDVPFNSLPKGGKITINEVMLAVTDMLHSVDVQVFELSMWQAFTGHTAPRSQHLAPSDNIGDAP